MPADPSRAGTALAPADPVPAPAPVTGGPSDASRTALRQLDASALLSVWEEGATLDPPRRGISLLSAAWPEAGWDHWLHASIGRRDGWLLTLREELFGDRLETVAACPSCGAPLEIALRTGDLRVPAAHPSPAGGAPGESPVRVEMDGYRVEGRLPTTADLIEVLSGQDGSPGTAGQPQGTGASNGNAAGDSLEASGRLLRRCISVATRGDGDVDPAALPPGVTEAVAQAMADADPQAEVRLALGCPDCGHRWSSPFDILSYLWDEVDDWATRLLREVHALASAYGWSERAILGMSARRRRLYLEMCGGWA